MERHNYQEFLTPEELREAYDLEKDEDLVKFVRKINMLSKGSKIILLEESQGRDDSDE